MKQTKLAKIVVLKIVKNVQLLEHVLPALRDMTWLPELVLRMIQRSVQMGNSDKMKNVQTVLKTVLIAQLVTNATYVMLPCIGNMIYTNVIISVKILV